ncbi:hemagglutinin repeat-containing protein [Glaesserella parasuis]|uniref:hemagglutinin repeat-containing protein n=1 Tax=Glaesserella parasuis TaxID=738 RepID=UPI0024372692|nr:hemagglutinin repeat-containing protein [Glaesserella parasuis]MDG6303296.1 hemagglutinin repeat-containing protein [Glaesserella parasuis]MDG6823224.1 hemagglutinin repeat-containing protein [Glaesserella parasuis]MDO9958642.1 hemagglutinin repeat-containing protein [Glaesserella parasuis]MDP0051980.1 hemagglutinin repeat-containing protein [Glaesserella parasuis]
MARKTPFYEDDKQQKEKIVLGFVGKSGGSTGLDIEGAVSIGKGHSNSDSQVQNHTEINADRLTMKANETTTLKGATANINHLALDTKNLHIESAQYSKCEPKTWGCFYK